MPTPLPVGYLTPIIHTACICQGGTRRHSSLAHPFNTGYLPLNYSSNPGVNWRILQGQTLARSLTAAQRSRQASAPSPCSPPPVRYAI